MLSYSNYCLDTDDENRIFEDIKNFEGRKPLVYPLIINIDLTIFPHKKRGVIDFWLKDCNGHEIEGTYGPCRDRCNYNATKKEIRTILKRIVTNAA